MTRKEPRLSDDFSVAMPSAPEPAARPRETSRAPVAPPSKPRTPWILWVFTLVSLSVSTGIGLFALQEGGQYQAELRAAREQARALSEQLRLVTETQNVATGELALSDQQTRQAVIAAEGRIKQEFGLRLSQADRAMDALQAELAKVKTNLGQTETSIKRLQTRNDTLQTALDSTNQALSTVRGTQSGLESRFASEISGLAGAQELLAQAQTALTESVGLVRTELITERDRITDLVAEQSRLDTLERQLTEATLGGARLERELQLVQQQLEAIARLELALTRLDQRVTVLAEPDPALLTLEVLTEQVERMTQQQRAQQALLESIDAARKQLTQRLIDVDGRVQALGTGGNG
ncbi:MAG: hypothetical protein EBS77_05060 [Gammaproteobacteria bacterium]|nr:hypothetical protein [Gammaproteobacteria bacterium]